MQLQYLKYKSRTDRRPQRALWRAVDCVWCLQLTCIARMCLNMISYILDIYFDFACILLILINKLASRCISQTAG